MKTFNTYYDTFEKLTDFLSQNRDSIFEWDPSAILVQIFNVNDGRKIISKIASEISTLLPQAVVVAASSGNVIMNGEVGAIKPVLSFSIFYHSKVRCALLPKEEKSDYQLGVSLASLIHSETAKVLILYTASSIINATEVLSGIGSVNPALPVAGGRAGEPCNNIGAILYCNGQFVEVGVLGIVLEGEQLTANRYWHLGWQPIGKTMTITKAEGFRVYTIDHLPAFQIYKKYLGLNKTGKFSDTTEYPLIVSRDGIQMARVPVTHYEDDSITFAADLKTGEKVRLSFGNIGIILDGIESVCEAIQQQPVESIFVYSCSCRRGYLQNFSSLETEPLQAIAPTAGFCASGEFFHKENRTHLFNATITMLALSENKTRSKKVIPYKRHSPVSQEIYKDTLNAKHVGILRALTHLVNTVISELEQTQAELQYNVIGEMAAGIGHEVRNPMTTVRGYLQMFQNKEEFSAYRKQLAVMIDELDRANLIITRFLSLSKNKRVELRLSNINSVLKNLFPLLQADAYEQGHEIFLKLSDIPDFSFDDKEIVQLVVNLVRNGLEAMKSPGVLIISTNYSNKFVTLSVEDTGSGIAPEILGKLGTPFVTTKEEGTGIGLSVCFRIAERHKAVIDITTSKQGTKFTVSFKVAHF